MPPLRRRPKIVSTVAPTTFWKTLADACIFSALLVMSIMAFADFFNQRSTFPTPVFDTIVPPGSEAKRIVFILGIHVYIEPLFIVLADGLDSDTAFKGFFNNEEVVMNNLKSRVLARDDSLCMVSKVPSSQASTVTHLELFSGVTEPMQKYWAG